jgi:hypothetical protein
MMKRQEGRDHENGQGRSPPKRRRVKIERPYVNGESTEVLTKGMAYFLE